MYLSRIQIENFRNFSTLDVPLDGNIVVVGENRVGKSNLLYALRLIFDPTLPDSARQLGLEDFWDGLEDPGSDDKIVVSVEVRDFDDDWDVLAQLTDFRLDEDPDTVRLTYEFRPRGDLEKLPASEDDYEFVCYGGENDTKTFGHGLRRRISMDMLPALRDAEGDLATWRRSPLRPLIESAFRGVDRDELEEIKEAVQAATARLGEFEAVKELEDRLGTRFAEMSGSKQDIKPRLGFGVTEATRLYRNIKLLVDDGQRSITDASLGSANMVFLTLKSLELQRQMDENVRDHTLLAIEEPEAHLHPHLQRSVYRDIFEDIGGNDENTPLSVLLTTHSPHIASVVPLRSIVLLKETAEEGTAGHSTAGISLTDTDEEDLARYLDVTRAEMMFARGIILVEGDAEKFLLPVFAEAIHHPLDHAGITVCSVSGTNFEPYAKFLTSLNIPFSIVTDWDPAEGKHPLAINRALKLIRAIERERTGEEADEVMNELNELAENADEDDFAARCEDFGVFTNTHTLEVDLFRDKDFTAEIIAALREQKWSAARQGWIDGWETNPATLETDNYLKLIESVGKGRFAQRLASRVEGIEPPPYIKGAIDFVVNRV